MERGRKRFLVREKERRERFLKTIDQTLTRVELGLINKNIALL